ncbi:Maltase 1 [Bulinus truncatus]|nr:Maltase 1 [Bulinus truncatus]
MSHSHYLYRALPLCCSVLCHSILLWTSVFADEISVPRQDVRPLANVTVTPSPASNLTWWQAGVLYQIYPRSFKDSDGDGVGDIRGIISELDYLSYLGIDCVWLSPVCKSPMKDFGYDSSDYNDIDPVFGTLDDYRNLVSEIHKRGLRIISDFQSVYSSDQHDWFVKSVRREGKYSNYYVWSDGKLLENGTRLTPNNWLSIFGGPAWTWNDQRQQFYYHVFLKEQPDLNHRDPNVWWEMLNILRFWLDLGVDGFRTDAISALYEAENLTLNEPPSGRNVPRDQEDFLSHIYTTNQPEIYPEVTTWYELLEEYKQKDGKERYMVIEIYENATVRNRLYSTGGNPFNFDLIDMNSSNLTGYEVYQTVMKEYDNLPSSRWPNFVLGNHDVRRVSHRFGSAYSDVFNVLLLTLWGTPTTYYGEELGMLEARLTWERTLDPWGLNFGKDRYEEFSRDPERSPMQWAPGAMAGFTTGNSTWLPLAENYTTLNVKNCSDAAFKMFINYIFLNQNLSEQSEKESDELTSVKLYQHLVSLRRKQAFQTGLLQPVLVSENIFSYIRRGQSESYLVVMNFREEETIKWTLELSPVGTVVAVTPGLIGISLGHVMDLENWSLGQGQGIILQLTSVTSPIIG